MTSHETHTDDSQTDGRHSTGTGKTATLIELIEPGAVSPPGWTFIDPTGTDALDEYDELDLTASGGED